MEKSQGKGLDYSGKSITKNTIYNFLGYGIPMLIAVAIIPQLINGLGTERFGILSLSWMVIGYFSFFDFGIGRSLTKITAEKIGKNQQEQIPGLFWTSLFLMFASSFFFIAVLIFFVPSLVDLFNISEELQSESLRTFYILVLSIPLVATTSGLRGVLEAYQKFAVINVMRVFLGTFTFLIPLICLFFTQSLFWIILLLILIRIVVWILYLYLCFKVNDEIKKNIRFEIGLIMPVLKFSAWITVANIVGPIIINMDRFLIGALISAKVVTFYATPYEVVTKLLIIPNAFVIVLFPVFSSSFFNNKEVAKKLFSRGVKFIFIILYPIIFLIVSFSYQGIELWLGAEFVEESSRIMQILAIGILINSMALIPFNFFQGVGRPNVPAILNLIELPIYLLMMWVSIETWGIRGAAYTWLLRIIVDTIILFFLTYKNFDITFELKLTVFVFLLPLMFLGIQFFFEVFYLRIFFTVVFLTYFLTVVWRYFITIEEKHFLMSLLKRSAA